MEPTGRREAPPDDRLRAIRGVPAAYVPDHAALRPGYRHLPAAHSPCHFRVFRVKARHVRSPRTPGGLLRRMPWAALRPINFCKNKDLNYGDDRQGIEGDRTSEERQGGRPG